MYRSYKHLNFLQKFLQQIGSRLIQRLLSFVLIKKSQKVSNNVEGIFKLKPRGNFFAELTLEKCFQFQFFFFLPYIFASAFTHKFLLIFQVKHLESSHITVLRSNILTQFRPQMMIFIARQQTRLNSSANSFNTSVRLIQHNC